MSLFRITALVLASAVTIRSAAAQYPTDSLTLDAAVSLARQANPMLQAARLRADAAAERISQAGALPDPMLSFGLMNRPLNDFGTGERMTMNQVQLTQRIPWPGQLGFAAERARRLAAAEAFSAAETEAQLTSRIAVAYYDVAFIDRALEVMGGTRDLLRDFHQVSQAMYAVGEGLQQDVLRAQVAIARMTEDITVMQQRRVAVVARLNALLGRDATVPAIVPALPEQRPALASVDSLMEIAVTHRPALRAAAERAEAARAGYRAARRALYPDFMVSLAYGQRPAFDDMGTVMVGVSLPIWAGKRQLALRREMAAMEAAAEAEAQNLSNETFAALTELRASAERARALQELYATAVLPQAHAAVESALSAYRVGQVDYMTLVDNQMTVNRYEIEQARLTAEYLQLAVQIEALTGRAALEGEVP